MEISEIMYNPSVEQGKDAYNEWVILHNTLDQPVDVGGWILGGDRIIGDSEHGNGSTIIPPHGYAIVTYLNTRVYEHFMIKSEFVRLQVDDEAITPYGLNNKGDTIVLEDPSGNVVDEVEYSPTWGGNGNGKTIVKEDGTWVESEKVGGSLWSPGRVKIKKRIYFWESDGKRYHVPYYSITFVADYGRDWEVDTMIKEKGEEWFDEGSRHLVHGNQETQYPANKKYTFRHRESFYGMGDVDSVGHWPSKWVNDSYGHFGYTVDPYSDHIIKMYAININTKENYTSLFEVSSLNEDSDGDGLSDVEEEKYYSMWYPGIDSKNNNSDGDGWSDGEEIMYYYTNPANEDTDGDGVLDSWRTYDGNRGVEIYKDMFPYEKKPDVYISFLHIWQLDPVDSSLFGEDPADFEIDMKYRYIKQNGEYTNYNTAIIGVDKIGENDPCPSPYYDYHFSDVRNDYKGIEITISIYDVDDFSKEICDISPLSGSKSVTLTYSFEDGMWTSSEDSIRDPSVAYVYQYANKHFGDEYPILRYHFWGYGFVSGEEDGTTEDKNDENDCALLITIHQSDNDNDGLPYWREVNIYHTDASKNDGGDVDSDGIPNYYENTYYPYMNPVDADDKWSDPDEDNVPNILEYRFYLSPASKDDGKQLIEHLLDMESQRMNIYAAASNSVNWQYVENLLEEKVAELVVNSISTLISSYLFSILEAVPLPGGEYLTFIDMMSFAKSLNDLAVDWKDLVKLSSLVSLYSGIDHDMVDDGYTNLLARFNSFIYAGPIDSTPLPYSGGYGISKAVNEILPALKDDNLDTTQIKSYWHDLYKCFVNEAFIFNKGAGIYGDNILEIYKKSYFDKILDINYFSEHTKHVLHNGYMKIYRYIEADYYLYMESMEYYLNIFEGGDL